MTSPKYPIALPRCSSGNCVSRMTCVSGIMMPAAIPCSILPASSTEYTGANAAKMVPAMNIIMPVKYRDLDVNLLIRNADTGIMIPLTRKKPVVSHCAVLNGMSKAAMIGGTAVTQQHLVEEHKE